MLPGSQPPRVDQCHCFAARRAARQISRFYDAHLQPTGLRITQFLILLTLDEVRSAALTELADRLDVEATAMGKMVGTLERDGLVRIGRSPEDGRRRVVQLTPEGRASFERAVPLWGEAQRRSEEANERERPGVLRRGLALPKAGAREVSQSPPDAADPVDELPRR